MPASIASLLALAGKSSSSMPARLLQHRRRGSIGSTQVWFAVAAGSVALLLVAAHRRRRAARAAEERALLLETGPFRWLADNEPAPVRAIRPIEVGAAVEVEVDAGVDIAADIAAAVDAASSHPPPEQRGPAAKPIAAPAASASSRRGNRGVPAASDAPAVLEVPAYSVELPLPEVHRAALAATFGHPAALRRLALELQQGGQEAEAGLLENYALLLERSIGSRERVMAEVTRMLRAAAADRNSARRHPRRSLGPAPLTAERATAPMREERSLPSSSSIVHAGEQRAPRACAVVPLPTLAVGPRRRSGR